MAIKDAHQGTPSPEPLPPEEASADVAAPDEKGSQEQGSDRLIVAGIGASAGGIEALQAFFEALPDNLGVAFVVVIHLSPEHHSHLAEILAKCTTMPAEQVHGRVPLEGDHIYVIPPDRRLEITDSQIGAFPFEEPRGQRAPIDLFFRSLAEQHGDGFAVILSGGGSDGAVGVKAVKERGGLVLVQDPLEAASGSMPRAAIATGMADVVLPVRELATRLADLTGSKRRIAQTLNPESPALLDGGEQVVARILAHLRARTGHDFAHYKRTTVLRRLSRRMQVQRQETLGDYLAFLHQNVEEAQALFDDLLISVTTFFRDPAAFEALQEQVFAKLFETKAADQGLRIWAPGCASGEEAYSLAMLVLEEASRHYVSPEIQIFASDVDEGALATAREGRYPAAIEADVSPEWLQRFFMKEGNHYRVTKEVRDCVLFASHSLLKDPPFTRLNLISCRNLLIYLDHELQAQVFDLFRYALRPGGYLFLGASETAESTYFRPLDKKHHLYQARDLPDPEFPHLPDFLSTPRRRTPAQYERARPEPPLIPTLHRKLLEELAPPSILVDENRSALHLSETAGRFLQPPAGPLTSDVIELVRPELQSELRAALYQAFEREEASLSPFVPVQFNGTPRRVAVLVRPRRGEDGERLALVMFLDGGEAAPAHVLPAEGEVSAEALRQLQEALRHSEERLRTTGEEYQAATEEFRAANEELLSLNEEYRVAAEELETSKEELQSLNEELETVNTELKHRLEEISRAHSDLENLIAASGIGMLFLDRQLRIDRFTPRLTDLFNIMSGDIGRPIGDFTHHLDYDWLEADARQVLDELTLLEREVQSVANRWYLIRFRPYRTLDNKIDGVVVTFVDITERKQAEEEIRTAKQYAESIIETLHEPLLVLTPDLRVKSANPAFYEQFQVRPEQTEGRLIYELGNNQWNIPELRTLLEAVLPENNIFTDYEVTHTFETIGERVMRLNGRRLDHVQLILLAIEDVTKRRQAEAALEELNQTLEDRVIERTEQVSQSEDLIRQMASRLTLAEQEERRRISQVLHDELQQFLYGIQLKIGFIRHSLETGEREQLLTQAEQSITLIDDAITIIRQLTVDLSPPVLPQEGLTDALGWLVTQMKELHGLEVKVEAEQSFPLADDSLRVLLFQIIRELLFNVVKHAATDQAGVTLHEEAGSLVMQISDGGRGFEVEAVAPGRENGFGLRSMRERLNLIGGRMEIASQPGEGTRVTIYTPLKPQQKSQIDRTEP